MTSNLPGPIDTPRGSDRTHPQLRLAGMRGHDLPARQDRDLKQPAPDRERLRQRYAASDRLMASKLIRCLDGDVRQAEQRPAAPP